jgi:hypothetical protein
MAQQGQSELASLLTAVRSRIDAINKEKAELVAALTQMLAAARADLTGSATAAGAHRKGGRRPGFKMSDEAKARISAAAKKRLARTGGCRPTKRLSVTAFRRLRQGCDRWPRLLSVNAPGRLSGSSALVGHLGQARHCVEQLLATLYELPELSD